MARKSMCAPLRLTGEQRAKFKELSGSRKAAKHEVACATVMLGYANGISVTELQRSLEFSRPMIKPHKIRYDLENRDSEFDRKMQEVLMVYQDASLYQEDAVHDARPIPIYTVSADEKPGVQTIGLVASDLPPVPEREPNISRDYETVSILTGIDLHKGRIFANVEDRHRRVEFVGLLKIRCALPRRRQHPDRLGLPFSPHFQRDYGLLGYAPRSM